MPALQTTYGANQAAFLEGMVANSEPAVIISRIIEGAAGLGFGKAAVRGTAATQAKASTASTKFLGVSVLDPSQPADTYAEGATAAIMQKGVIAVLASVDVAHGDAAYIVPATGVFTNVATSNTAVNGVFDSTATAGSLAKLRLY